MTRARSAAPAPRQTGNRRAGTGRVPSGGALLALQGTADAGPVPRPLHALQCLADDALAADGLRLRPPPTAIATKGPTIQRVGEAKQDIALLPEPLPPAKEPYSVGKTKLADAAKAANVARKNAKDDHWAKIKARSEGKPADRKGINAAYATVLKDITFERFLLQQPAFAPPPSKEPTKLFATAGTGTKTIGYAPTGTETVDVATLTPRTYTKLAKQPDEAKRAIFTGGADKKEYVEDKLGVKTRRYAFVEKNFHQMMEFFGTGFMEGRFQSLVRAGTGAERPDVRKPGQQSIAKDYQRGRKGPLSDTQLAFVHQHKGSGDHQRGLSLTSTPRKGETIGNAGENFRTDDGFMLKIDLARIPTSEAAPILLNHYATGGVRENLGDVRNPVKNGKNYKYDESVTKNRELYLEFLRPEYVVEIEYHPKKAVGDTGSKSFALKDYSTNEEFMNAVRTASAFDKYQLGFDSALKGEPLQVPSNTDATCKKGWDTASLYVDAYDKTTKPTTPGITTVDPFAEKAKYFTGPPSEFTIIKIARIHAMTGRPKIRKLADLGPKGPTI